MPKMCFDYDFEIGDKAWAVVATDSAVEVCDKCGSTKGTKKVYVPQLVTVVAVRFEHRLLIRSLLPLEEVTVYYDVEISPNRRFYEHARFLYSSEAAARKEADKQTAMANEEFPK